MKLTTLKSLFALVSAITAMHFFSPNVYAIGPLSAFYLRVQDTSGNKLFSSYKINDSKTFNELNKTYLGGAAYRTSGSLSEFSDAAKTFYIVMPGYQKRFGIFKLQKSTNGEKDGPRENLVFGTKAKAEEFCTSLSSAAGDFELAKFTGGSAFVSDYFGGVKQVIAVAYSVPYKGDLIPAKKHVFCPNKWGVSNEYWQKPDPKYFDENETTGVQASGFVRAGRDTYKVVCTDSQVPETTFSSTSEWKDSYFREPRYMTTWSNGTYTYETTETAPEDMPTLEQLDAKVGTPYCTQSS